LIDEVDVYNRALSAAEIEAIFNAGNAGKCTDGVPSLVEINIKSGSINPRSTRAKE
jgi:hypothetical protein